jgi:1-acyl-sn-glycerol-3-phosphate acyltransferase
MKNILAYPLSAVHYLVYGLLLVLFHPLQWLTLHLFGYKAHKKTVDYLNFMLIGSMYLFATRVKFINKHKIPKNVPIIIVSNHQSAYDIPPISWFLRKTHPKFVSKIELGKGIPSVSFNLKHGGSVLIDRKDAKQALSAIANFAKSLEKNNWSGVIFPEGTRSKTGVPKRFSENGLKILTKYAPSAYILPVTINNSWKLVQKGVFPLGVGEKFSIEAHKAIPVASMKFEDLFQKVEETIKNSVTLLPIQKNS